MDLQTTCLITMVYCKQDAEDLGVNHVYEFNKDLNRYEYIGEEYREPACEDTGEA